MPRPGLQKKNTREQQQQQRLARGRRETLVHCCSCAFYGPSVRVIARLPHPRPAARLADGGEHPVELRVERADVGHRLGAGRAYVLHFANGQWQPGFRTDLRTAPFEWKPFWNGNPWSSQPRLFMAGIPNWMLMLPCFAAAAALRGRNCERGIPTAAARFPARRAGTTAAVCRVQSRRARSADRSVRRRESSRTCVRCVHEVLAERSSCTLP